MTTTGDGSEAPRGPLDGLVVLDLTRIMAGPLATMLLSDLGAEVVKVERPGTGDDTRSWGPPFRGGDATYFLGVNRGKRSVVVDLASSEGREQLLRLAGRADVVVENFRSGVMARLGLGYDTLAAANPRLVYCSIPAFASLDTGKPGYDLLMQAAAGLMSVTGEGSPVKAGVAVLDVVTGLYATTGILAALAARERTGRGQQVTVGLFEASLTALVNQGAAHLLAGVVPGLAGNAHPSIVPYQLFQGSDVPFVLAAGNDKLYRATALLAGLPELAADPRFATNAGRVAHREELVAALQGAFSRAPAEQWVARCDEHGVPACLVRTLDQVFAAPEAARSTFTVDDPVRGPLRYVANPVELSDTPLRAVSAPPPHLGEHDALLSAAPPPVPTAQPAVLVAAGVGVRRGERTLLADVDLTVGAGERWALLGGNGAGKTTLLALLAARRFPTSGTVDVLGQRLGRVAVHDLWPRIGQVQPTHVPSGRLTCRQVVLTGATGAAALPLRERPGPALLARVDELCRELGLEPVAAAPWTTLSAGERGRALVARALVNDPPLLLLDEPATGLDLPARERLVEALDTSAAVRPDRALVLVTHALEELPASTTHALLLRGGRVLAAGPVEEVLRDEPLSECFGLALRLRREDGRWSTRARR